MTPSLPTRTSPTLPGRCAAVVCAAALAMLPAGPAPAADARPGVTAAQPQGPGQGPPRDPALQAADARGDLADIAAGDPRDAGETPERALARLRARAAAQAAADEMAEDELHSPEAALQDARIRKARQRYRERALEDSIDMLLPLDPADVARYRTRRDTLEQAIEPGPARMSTQTRQLTVTPGAVPQTIRLTSGYSSTVVFQDATGAPWPVLAMVLGAARSFAATQPRVEQEVLTEGQAASAESPGHAAAKAGALGQTRNVASNVVNIVPLTNHASSNLAVTLEGAPYPVVLHLLTESAAKDGRVADALVVLRLDRPGPNAREPELRPHGPNTVSAEMLQLVHGIAPKGAGKVRVAPRAPGIAVWEIGGRYYLRTPHALVWPAWSASAAGEDVRVYVIPKTPSIVVAADGRQQKFLLGQR